MKRFQELEENIRESIGKSQEIRFLRTQSSIKTSSTLSRCSSSARLTQSRTSVGLGSRTYTIPEKHSFQAHINKRKGSPIIHPNIYPNIHVTNIEGENQGKRGIITENEESFNSNTKNTNSSNKISEIALFPSRGTWDESSSGTGSRRISVPSLSQFLQTSENLTRKYSRKKSEGLQIETYRQGSRERCNSIYRKSNLPTGKSSSFHDSIYSPGKSTTSFSIGNIPGLATRSQNLIKNLSLLRMDSIASTSSIGDSSNHTNQIMRTSGHRIQFSSIGNLYKKIKTFIEDSPTFKEKSHESPKSGKSVGDNIINIMETLAYFDHWFFQIKHLVEHPENNSQEEGKYKILNYWNNIMGIVTNSQAVNTQIKFDILCMQGDFHKLFKDIDSAIIAYQLAKLKSEEEGELKYKAGMYSKLGICYRELNEHDIAIQFFKKQLQLAWDLKLKTKELEAYDNLGIEYFYKGDLDRSIYYHQRATTGDIEGVNSALRTICPQCKHVKETLKKEKMQKDLQYFEESMIDQVYKESVANDIRVRTVKLNSKLSLFNLGNKRKFGVRSKLKDDAFFTLPSPKSMAIPRGFTFAQTMGRDKCPSNLSNKESGRNIKAITSRTIDLSYTRNEKKMQILEREEKERQRKEEEETKQKEQFAKELEGLSLLNQKLPIDMEGYIKIVRKQKMDGEKGKGGRTERFRTKASLGEKIAKRVLLNHDKLSKSRYEMMRNNSKGSNVKELKDNIFYTHLSTYRQMHTSNKYAMKVIFQRIEGFKKQLILHILTWLKKEGLVSLYAKYVTKYLK